MQETTTTTTEENPAALLRDHAAASVERRRTSEYVRYASTPGVIHHPDGVLEVPEAQTSIYPIFERIPNTNTHRS